MDKETGAAIDELRGIVAEFDMRLKATSHVLAEMVAISGDLSWLARLSGWADEHERNEREPLSAHAYREALERIAALAEARLRHLEDR